MKIVINPSYIGLRSFIEKLPTLFSQMGETIYIARNEIKTMTVDEINIVVKQYKIPIFINRIIYSFFRKSKARRAFEYANRLLECGVRTPTPIAYLEIKRGGLFYQSYYISLQDTYPRIFREFNEGGVLGREDILTAFARYSADLHEKGILHLDYTSGNILFEKTDEGIHFSLVDLNRMKFGPISKETCLRNFERLLWDSNVLAFIVAGYARARGWADVDACVEKVLNYHIRFEKKNKGKKAFKKFLKSIGKK